jgi:alpha-mannosidase
MSQPEDIKNKIKTYIKEGRLEIINGGWVMHDEASVHFNHLFDNMRLGLEFLKNEFNIMLVY